jgi:hypothetical protein
VVVHESRKLPNTPHWQLPNTHRTHGRSPARLSCALPTNASWRELAKAKYAQWQQQSELRTTATAALKAQLDSLLSSSRGGVAQQEPFSSRLAQAAAAGGSGSNSQGPADTPEQLLQHAWEALFERAAHLDVRTEVPSHLLCPLTMEVRLDGDARGGG